MNAAARKSDIGNALATTLAASFVDGVAFVTEEGGWLRFGSGKDASAENSGMGVRVDFLGAVAPLRESERGDDLSVFALVTALVDAAGVIWERRRIVSIFEIWRAVSELGELQVLEDLPKPANGRRAQRRTLLEPIETLFDSRDYAFVSVLIPGTDPAKPSRLLFRLRFKYFGAKIGLVEDSVFYAQAAGGESQITNLTFSMSPLTDSDAIGRLDEARGLISADQTRLMKLGPLSARGSIIAGWEQPHGELPRRGEIEVWRRACEGHMHPASLERALRPNPNVWHELRD